MNKLTLKTRPLNLPYATPSAIEPAHRLIVLVHGAEMDLSAVTRRVWELAGSTGAQVRFLGLCNDAAQEPSLKRILITISALVNSGNVTSDSEIIADRDWINAVKSRLQPGDMVVCWKESNSGRVPRALVPLLHADLGVPIYLLSGIPTQPASHTSRLPALAAWIGSLAIIVGFFFIQAELGHLTKGWAIGLQLLSIAAEFQLLLKWNSLL